MYAETSVFKLGFVVLSLYVVLDFTFKTTVRAN